MIGYGSDMYVSSYEGDAWSWGGQPWGSGYEQVQYDCSGAWGEYQQQPSWQAQAQAQAPEAPGPKVGAELLTELRLAELKRLIDRDARALKASTEVVDIESTDSADCTTRAPDSNEDTPTKEDTASSAHSVPQEAKARHFTSEADDTDGRTASYSRSKVVQRSEGDQAEVGATTSSSTAPAPPPPGLDAPEEERYLAIADFSPEARNYGELPVSVGEEIFISGEPVDGWIFGVKRTDGGDIVDEGWLPASALPMPSLRGFEEDTPRPREKNSQSSANSRRGGRAQQQVAGAGGSRKGVSSSQQQQRGAASENWRKGGRADHEQIGKGEGKGDDQHWHQHGNWWSRQRHLSHEDADSHPSNAYAGASRKASSRPAPPPPPPASFSDEEQDAPHTGRKARGARGSRGGRGNGSTAASRAQDESRSDRQRENDRLPVERPARERRALTTMLDRLNKPLVAPKPAPADPVA
mmetsp:Transcript_33936/g.54009  ORF Transcript_33936/g.54009 Transcript_33936/m.54009 type:complete len:467 (-) Transcript_33936:109-1509(-)